MNLGDKHHVVSVRMNDEMFQWLTSESKKMGTKTLGEYIRVLLRVGMVTESKMEATLGDVVNVLSDEELIK